MNTRRESRADAEATAAAIDQLADQFEARWQAGERPDLLEFAAGVDAEIRSALLKELIQLDIQYCVEHGAKPRVEHYLAASPDLDRDWLHSLLASAEHPPNAAKARDIAVTCPHCRHAIRLLQPCSEEVVCPSCGSCFSTKGEEATEPLLEQRSLGRFELLERIGRGAFGEVWRARDPRLHRIVAIKTPHGGSLATLEQRERFQREARIASQLRHPGIVTIHEIGECDGAPIIVSEYVRGVPLHELLSVHRLPERETATLLAEVAEALEYAHSCGAVHRDIKPANIMVERRGPTTDGGGDLAAVGRPKLMDFGLALLQKAEITMTLEGQILGTPAYMSPEQAAGHSHEVDGRSDIYSLGAVMYQMLTGELPFRGSKLMLVEQVLHGEPRPPRKFNRRIPKDLETICLKAMSKRPEQRYDRARDFAEDLRRWLKGEPILARPTQSWERSWRWCRRHPVEASLSAAVLLLLLGLVVGQSVAYQRIQEQQRLTLDQRQLAVDALIEAIALARPDSLPSLIPKVQQLEDAARPGLRRRFDQETTTPEQRVNLACGLSALGDSPEDYLISIAPRLTAEQCPSVARALAERSETVSPRLLQMLDATQDPQERLRIAAILFALGKPEGLELLLNLTADRSTRTLLIHSLTRWCWNWEAVSDLLRTTTDPGVRSGLLTGLGLADRSKIPPAEQTRLAEALEWSYLQREDGSTHCAADWTLRQWRLPPPVSEESALEQRHSPRAGWFEDGLGLTMVRISPRDHGLPFAQQPAFFISAHEITTGQFQEFLRDDRLLDSQKPCDWVPPTGASEWEAESPGNLPVCGISLTDAILFCNWLSVLNARDPCYEIGNYVMSDQASPFDRWRFDLDRDGYRLPTLRECQIAYSAGAEPYSFGPDLSWLPSYAWFQANAERHPHPVGMLAPNAYGLFDVFGNALEAGWSRDPEKGVMMLLGGDWRNDEKSCGLNVLYFVDPHKGSDTLGLRVVVNAPSDESKGVK